MLYRNKKTGAFIDTESKLSGVWEEYIPSYRPELIEKPKNDIEVNKVEKIKEQKSKVDDISFDDVKISDIKQELDALGIKYNPKAKKQELWNLMMEGR